MLVLFDVFFLRSSFFPRESLRRHPAIHRDLCMRRLVEALQQAGYRDGETLFGAPYDFRQALAARCLRAVHPAAEGARGAREQGERGENEGRTGRERYFFAALFFARHTTPLARKPFAPPPPSMVLSKEQQHTMKRRWWWTPWYSARSNNTQLPSNSTRQASVWSNLFKNWESVLGTLGDA